MLEQFFILSPRGDTLITKNFRGETKREACETFFRTVTLWKGDAPPIFNIEGVNFIYLKKNNLYFVVTTLTNIAPSYTIEIIQCLIKVIKDFCGVLSEEAIRKNFVLAYEILDEIVDYGYPQSVSTEQIRPYIVNETIAVDQSKQALRPNLFQTSTVSHMAVFRPIQSMKKSKKEIFVDIFEKVAVLFNSSGYVINSSIDGCIQMKSYLENNPQLQLGLNEDLVVGRRGGGPGIVLDDCNFHECVDLKEFEDFKRVLIKPPDGEFTVMNYRITGDYQAPFRIFPFVEEQGPFKLELVIKIRACFPSAQYGANVVIKFSVPRHTQSVNCELPKGASGQNWEYKQGDKITEWTIKKFQGGSEHNIRARISTSQSGTIQQAKKELGPISMIFEIPMYNVSNLQVKYLKIDERGQKGSGIPCRWVRYVTHSSSYVCRL